MNTTPEGEMAPRKSWWGRNWAWALPVGCLGLLLSCGCLGAIIAGLTFQAMRSSNVFVEALEQAKQSPAVREALGEPIEAGWMFQGSVQTTNDEGKADMAIPLKGSKSSGTLYVKAHKSGGMWKFTTLRVEVPDHQPFNVLGAPPSPPDNTVPFPDTLPQVEPLPEEEPDAPEPPEDSDSD